MATSARVPTVNDLRVKLCYICREEESAEDPPQDHARAWTHPCNCTLIAHEQCLLKWIQASQGNAARAPNALKCPQCGTEYEMTSDEPALLRVLNAGNKVLQRLGRYFTVIGAAGVIGVVGTSVYICLTAYGAWALEKFIGKELYDTILTDDPVNWPWSAFFNLPLIPISLVLSRFQPQSTSSVLFPLLIVWPPSAPVGSQSKKIYDYWLKPENAQQLDRVPFFAPVYWPPPPVLFGLIGVPIVKALYQVAYGRLYKRVLGVPLPVQSRGIPRDGLRFNEGPFLIRIRANVQRGDGAGEENADAQPVQPPQPNNNNGHGAPADPNAEVVEAAEQLIEINAASLGRRICGALLIPAVSSVMGDLLYRLSQHSRVLRAFLGIRHHRGFGGRGNSGLGMSTARGPASFWVFPPIGKYASQETWKHLTPWQQFTTSLRFILTIFFGGSKVWMDAEPVWWRNAVGFGLFVAAKDCLQLLHLWLAKRELESRKVKDKDFAGVDVRELDLLPSFFQAR